MTIMIFDAREYWPRPGVGAKVVNSFSSGIVHTYTGDSSGNVCLTQSIDGKWDFDWFYRFDISRGVLEYRDDYPKKWYNYAEFWKPTREVWCVSGKEIFWGSRTEHIGMYVGRPCATTGIFGQNGWQELYFEAILPKFRTADGVFYDVLLMTYWQDWGNKKIDGARMFLAKGIGQIRAEWAVNKKPTGYSMELISTKEEWE